MRSATAPGLIAGALAIVLLGKPLVALLIVRAMRYPLRTALTVSIALSQIGEFSFILATLGRSLGVFTPVGTNVIVATSIASIIASCRARDPLAPSDGPAFAWLRWGGTRCY
jgi:CPA2 family monovalent cation:H+ antiporter-2